jgi:hypothetical protein
MYLACDFLSIQLLGFMKFCELKKSNNVYVKLLFFTVCLQQTKAQNFKKTWSSDTVEIWTEYFIVPL